MTDHQKPLGSGFGARTTASDVLAGIDLTGRCAIVTGGHSGLGLETTRALAAAGAHVIVGARNPEAARAAMHDVPNVIVDALDLEDLTSIHLFAKRLLAAESHLDMLINNAGIMACPEMRVGPGWEAQFATNHLGHFALTNLISPLLEGGARVVSVSSAGHHASPIRWEDVQFTSGYDKWLAYGQSKTANALFAVHLDRIGRDRGIRAFSLHPGKIFAPPLMARPLPALSPGPCSYRAASSPSSKSPTSSPLSRGGRSLTVSLDVRCRASCRADRYHGSWGGSGDWVCEIIGTPYVDTASGCGPLHGGMQC